jgi:hypothetical protein
MHEDTDRLEPPHYRYKRPPKRKKPMALEVPDDRRRSDAADAMFRETKRRIAEKLRS